MNWLVRRRRLVCRFVVTVCLVLLSTSIASGSFISVAHSGSSGPYQAEDYVVHYVAPNASLLAEDARAAIGQSLRSWAGTTTSARSFYLINLRWEESWALGTLTFADLSQPLREGGESHLNFDNLLGLLLVSDLDGWRAAIEVDPQISDLLTLVPEEEFDSRSRRALFPSAEQLRMPDALAPNQAYDGYKFPWRAGPAWRVTQGWHDPSTWGGRFLSTTSLDFDIVGQSNADIVAPASGTVAYMCADKNNVLVVIKTDNTNEQLGLLHLDPQTVSDEGILQGMHVDQGRKLGRMREGSFSLVTCGYSLGTHVHVYFPEKPFTIDTVTFSQDNWHAAENLYSTQGSSPKPEAELWSEADFAGSKVWSGGIGFTNDPNADSHSLKLPEGWSAKTWREDNREGEEQCWPASVDNLQDHDWQSAIQSIEVYDSNACPPGAFKKSNPTNGDTELPVNPTLSWDTSTGAISYEYCCDTGDDSACGGTWANTGASTRVNLNGLSAVTTYYWQVRALNGAGTTDADTETWWSFTTGANRRRYIYLPCILLPDGMK